MTQTPGDLWARLRRPLLDPPSRFAWARPVLDGLRLTVDGIEHPLADRFARILYNDADTRRLAVGFSEAAQDRSGCEVLVKLERAEDGVVRLEVALAGRLAKSLRLGERPLVEHPGAPPGAAGTTQGPFPAVVVHHLAVNPET